LTPTKATPSTSSCRPGLSILPEKCRSIHLPHRTALFHRHLIGAGARIPNISGRRRRQEHPRNATGRNRSRRKGASIDMPPPIDTLSLESPRVLGAMLTRLASLEILLLRMCLPLPLSPPHVNPECPVGAGLGRVTLGAREWPPTPFMLAALPVR
jgi:hypothetical protein